MPALWWWPILPILRIAGFSGAGTADAPILFVHGNGDSAALWHTTIWRFESNGYDPAALFAIDMPHPSAPEKDAEREINRSTTRNQLELLNQEVDRVLLATGAEKLVLVGSSRGGTRSGTTFGTETAVKKSP